MTRDDGRDWMTCTAHQFIDDRWQECLGGYDLSPEDEEWFDDCLLPAFDDGDELWESFLARVEMRMRSDEGLPRNTDWARALNNFKLLCRRFLLARDLMGFDG